MKTFQERCAEPIVEHVVRYRIVPRYIEGTISDSVRKSRFGEGYDHALEFRCNMGSEKMRPQTDLITNDIKDGMSERCIPEVVKELEKYPVIKSNYTIESLGRKVRMTKKEFEAWI